jgi:hypothetical protein
VKKTIIGLLIAATTTVATAAFAQPPPPVRGPGADPTWTPPAAPEPPPPPQAAAHNHAYAYGTPAPAVVVPAAPAGQWVYTNQYGWIWIPYSASYTYVPSAQVAYTYAYYPRHGWRWISTPWVLNVGPTPHWGRLGPSRFDWYGHRGGRGRPAFHSGRHARSVVTRSPAPHPAWRGHVVHSNGHGNGHRR